MRKILTQLLNYSKISILGLTLILVFSQVLMAESAASQSTDVKISISFNDEPLQQALDQIEKLSSIKFSYNPADIQGFKVSRRSYVNESIGSILKNILTNTKLSYKGINGGIVLYKRNSEPVRTAFQPQTQLTDVADPITVHGRVSDAQGPLGGVTVVVEGTTTSVSTNANGDYTIKAPSNAVLVFSFIGYVKQRIPVNSRAVINVNMAADSRSLNEIVVVGYGTQKKSDITGSITSINEKALHDVPAANLADALQGQGTGIDIEKSGGNSHPGAVPSIIIRGVRSAKASNDPLFVVDGIPYTGSIQDINVDDIVSVEVLKDASSTAIYGSRGANGVILVTTKRGKTGGPVITYSGYGGFSKPLGQYDVMNGPKYASLKEWAVYNGSFDAKTGAHLYTGYDDPNILTSSFFTPTERQALQDGKSTNWQDYIYKTGFLTNHQLGISGGTEKTQYDIAAGYYDETGIYQGQSFNRYTLKLSIDQVISKWLKVGISSLNNLSYIEGENANPLGQALRASPLASPYNADGTLLMGYVPGSQNQVWNPLDNFLPGASVESRKRFGTFTTGYAEAQILPGLKYRFNGGAEVKPDIYGNFYAAATTNNQGTYSSANNQSTYAYNYTLENILTYDRTYAKKHHINFTGLYSYQQYQSQSNSFNYNTILSDAIQYYNPQYGANLTGSGSYTKYALISYMGRINYGFEDKYLLTLTVRSDGSSKLAPGHKFDVFPSAAIGWNIMREKFLQQSNLISNLKLRLSYGSVANANISAYQTLGGLSPINYNYGSANTTGAYPTAVPNPNLGWEYTSTLNAGLDFGIFKDRITGSIDAYHEYTHGLLLPESLPYTTGIPTAVSTNVGKSENKGIEININTVNLPAHGRKSLSWTTSFNITFNRGKITQLANGVQNDISNNLFVGHPIGSIYDYKKTGIWQNTAADSAAAKGLGLTLTGSGSVIGTIKVADINHDGKIDANDRTIIGSNQPFCNGGLTNRISYNGFDLTLVTAYRFGGLLTSAIYQSGSFLDTYQGNYNNLNVNFWTPYNHENFFPKPNSSTTNTPYSSTLSYFNASYLKIRSLSLGYTFSSTLTKSVGIKSLRIYATAQNPFIFFSPYRNVFHGIDPETYGTLAENTPATWSMIFGANLSL